jgi:hypothetical protein
MKSTVLRISAAALLVMGAATTQACASAQYGRYPYGYENRRDVYYQRAFENGERDGYARGIDDLRHRRYADIQRQKWYRNGDHDYDRRFGPRDQYRVEYRRGFERGYDRAFREGYREGWRR